MLKQLAVGAGVCVALAACSSPSPNPSPSPSPTASVSPSPTGRVLPPIPITKAESITVNVGAFLNVTTPDVTKVTTNNAAVLEVSQPHSEGSAEFNGGARVLAPGQATLTVYGGITNSEMYTVKVTATPSTATGTPSGLQ